MSKRPLKRKAVAADYPRYPAERAAHDQIIDQLVAGGRTFWQHRNVNVPADLQVNVADSLADRDENGSVAAGRGLDARYGQPRLVLNGNQAGRLLARARNKRLTGRERRDAIEQLGQIVYHEEGHTAGINTHTPDGLMSADPGREAVPWEVQQYARKLIPHGRRTRRYKGAIVGGGESW